MYYNIMFILGKFRRKFFNQIPENNKQYLKSRKAFTIDGISAFSIIVLVANSYLSGFLEFVGVSDSLNGIISAIPALATISQPIGAGLVQKIKKRKMFVSFGALIHRLMFTAMFFVPVFVKSTNIKITLIVILFSGAHIIGSFINPSASNWIISLTPQKFRGKYFSLRELYCVLISSFICLFVGLFLDYFGALNKQNVGYICFGLVVLTLTIINFIALSNVMEPESLEQCQDDISFLKTIKLAITDANFKTVVVMGILYNLGIFIAIPYFGLYIVSDLKISYMYISVAGILGSIIKASSVRFMGRLADKKSWALVCKLSMIIVGLNHILCAFLFISNVSYMYPLVVIIGGIGWSGMGIALMNIQYDFAPIKGRTLYVGANAAITGVIGFFGVFIGAAIMKFTANHTIYILSEQIKGQQILMFLSGIILLGCALYIKTVVEKKKKLIIANEGLSV